MNHSALLTKEVSEEAFKSVEKSIRDFLKLDRSWRDGFHIVILDPRAKFGETDFEDAILFEYSINPEKWDEDLKTLARKKGIQAMMPLRTAYKINSGTLCKFSFCRM